MTRNEKLGVVCVFLLLLLAYSIATRAAAPVSCFPPAADTWCWDLPMGPPAPEHVVHGGIVAVYEMWSWDPNVWPVCQRLNLGVTDRYSDTALDPMLPSAQILGAVTYFQFTAEYESGAVAMTHGVAVACPVELCP